MIKAELHIDVETYSSTDLKVHGLYRYAEDEDFEIMLFSYAWKRDGKYSEVVTLDYYDELPEDVEAALTDPEIRKVAHNAAFEIRTISAHYGIKLDASQWFCTMIAAAYLGLPLKLEQLGKVLQLKEQKDKRGDQLIAYFAKPCKPTKSNGGRLRNLPHDDPDKWSEYKAYNAQDVRAEIEIDEYLARFDPMPAIEWAYWTQDHAINALGVCIDRELAESVIEANDEYVAGIRAEMSEITGLSNPNSLGPLKAWLNGNAPCHDIKSLNKNILGELLKDPGIEGDVRRVLELRDLSSKTSNSKYSKMLDYICKDGRVHGTIQFYGAGRTGRYAGRAIQLQNMPGTLDEKYDALNTARNAFKKGLAALLFEDVSKTASSIARTAIIAPKGKKLISCDFSAIEARVLAWLCGEEWVIEVFNTHGKIYEATAAKMYNVPFETIDKKSPYRKKGKVADLALGYQGGEGALINMGALREGLEQSELKGIRDAWRAARPKTVKLWRQVEAAAKHVIKNKTTYRLSLPGGTLEFSYYRGYMFIKLPSGRKLSYYGAAIEEVWNAKFERYEQQITYWGVDQTKKTWCKDNTYGGSLVENITQAIARDCLVEALYRMRHLDIIMHIHDEIVAEVLEEYADETLLEMRRLMAVRPTWAPDLPLNAEGYISDYFKKD